MTNTLVIVIVVLVIASLGLSLSLSQQHQQVAMAQVLSPPTVQQIIDDARAACERITEESGSSCVGLAHESPTLVVLGGKLLLNPFVGATIPYDNIFIWQAVDGFIALGYSIDSVQLTGQGTTENPHNLMIVMSK